MAIQTNQEVPRRRVIVAEDDAEMRALLDRALRREGFDVTVVADGLELIKAVQDRVAAGTAGSDLDLVISDVQMPGCDGLVALAALKRMGLEAPVVMITAFGDQHTHDEARRLGAAAVLDKPLNLLDLQKLATNLVTC